MPRRIDEPGTLDLLEEAMHLLRQAPAAAWAVYYASTLPFVLALLFFWADMTHSPLAGNHVEVAALGLALLYVAMRAGQVRFGARLRARAGDAAAAAPRGFARDLLAQSALAPAGLLGLVVSLFVVAPFGWVYAFHQSLVTARDPRAVDLRDQAARAVALSRPWPKQNHAFLGLVTVFRAAVYINFLVGFAVLPQLVKMFTGVETDYTRSYFWLMNTTFQALCVALTYLATDPFVKAFYALRGYYADARRTGADLLAAVGARASVLALLLLLAPGGAAAVEAPAPAPARASASVALDASVDRVMQRPEFLWRMPREFLPKKAEENKNFLERFFDGLTGYLKSWWTGVKRNLQRLRDWLEQKAEGWWPDRKESKARDPSHLDWMSPLNALSWILLGLLAAVLAVLLYRTWRNRPRRVAAAEAAPAGAVPDLEDESIVATQLPEEEWLALAEECLRQGDARKALRALFLATLAMLARAELVDVKRWKSNREYAGELARRARRKPEAPPAFAGITQLFERSWYGLHPATGEAVEEVRAQWGRLKAHVEA